MLTENKTAEQLQVERSTVTKLVITGAPRLEAITVFLEDFGRRDCPTESNPNHQTAQGKITITAGTGAETPTGAAWDLAQWPSSWPIVIGTTS